ncbi:hypothetical protein J1N35_011673 [Gossypium stocksii]|uniref:Transposase MuDR plant domain-containing protein n=1 Tax=Gossypium stocksii TaxID=47602 RepID=A0A9D3W4X4_9ROSI|nr:hypothetical protein J1N35_011673 [Gossypium stocksii]
MSERISTVIYYDGEVCHTENGVVFLSENTVRLVFNQNIELTDLHKRIRRKIFGTTPMKVLSIKYRFCTSDDPVTYDSFDIRGARGLEAMVQTYLASGTPYLELYVQLLSPNDVFAASTTTAVREEYTTPARHSVSGWQNTEALVFGSSTEYTTPARHFVSGWDMYLSESISDAGNTYWGTSNFTGGQATSDWGHYEMFRRRDDVLPMTSIGEGTSYVAADGKLDDEFDVDPPREPGLDGAEVALFSEPELVPTEAEGGSDEEEEDPRFRAYSPPAHMYNVDLSNDDALEFPDLPYRRRDRASLSLDSGELEVGKEFSNKDSFLGALKQHSIINGVNYNVVKSKSDKFEAKCAVKDGTCAWKIMTLLRKMTGLWKTKKYKGPHTCVGDVSQDHPKMDSSMCASLILLMLKEDLKISVAVLISHIRTQFRYTPSYRKVWIAKQKALKKMHSGWDASYNELWQWCQVLDKYVPGCITDLQTAPAYYNDRLLRGCQVFKRLFWTFKQCRDAFLYCKPLVQIDAVAEDGSGRILPIAFAITPGESADDWDCFLSRLRRHVCLQPDICIISDRGTGILSAMERERSLWQRTEHRYCLRHVASNYYGQYRSATERRQVTNMGYEISKDRFYEMLTILRSVNEEGADYLCNIPFEQWPHAYDGGLRYGYMTINLDECINSILKGTRHLPITSVVRETYFRLAALFPKQAATYKGQMQGGYVWCHKVLQAINKSKA